ncbi:YpeB-like protein with putative protease inhibitory function [Luteimonas cucumeris]|uniref:YpeB-like protein with putative protease inhibitory function n=1 Tax=Luteimonas cucumeris TaxID=985012 RepID=A0A562LEJ9_9GAMM|nr:PepSY domain-containing protein [Luteimonas cucumeris]TWI05975.1 YpeB-like protein with putative protease inhibitory function [Luteimonas cucumeris]
MKKIAALTLALLCATGTVWAQESMTAPQVRAKLTEQGYTRINDVKFEDGVWKADARSANGNRVDVRIDPATGTVYPDEQIANMSEADVRAALATAGYTNVHDVDYEDGIWNAEADDPAGKDVEVKIDPATGKVIGKEKD